MSISCRTAAHQIYHQMRMACPVCGMYSVYMNGVVSADMVDVLRTKIDQSFTPGTLLISKTHRPKATQERVYPHNLQFSKFSKIQPPTPYPGAGLQALLPTTNSEDPEHGKQKPLNLDGSLEHLNQRVSKTYSLSGTGAAPPNGTDFDMIPHTLVTLRARVTRMVPRIVQFSPGNARLRKRFMEMTSKICLPCSNPRHSDSQTSLSEYLEVNPDKEAQSTTNAMLQKIKHRLDRTKPRIVSSMPTNERLRNKFSSVMEGKSIVIRKV